MSALPAEPGQFWRYRCVTTDLSAAGGDSTSTETVETRVLSRYLIGHFMVRTMATSRLSEKSPVLSFNVEEGGRTWRITDPERLASSLSGSPPALDPGDADFAFPLSEGRRWGRPEMIARNDGLYVNRVEAPVTLDVPAGRFVALPVEYRTLPDQITTWVASEVGVVRYEYLHHGPGHREVWELERYGREDVDTLLIGGGIDESLDRLMAEGGFWSRRFQVASDAALASLLGPLTSGETNDLEDGIRVFTVRGESSSLLFEQIPDGPSFANVVFWKNRAGLIRSFLKAPATVEEGAAGPAAPAGPGSTNPKATPSLDRVLLETRAGFLDSRRMMDAGRVDEAGVLAEAAMARIADGLAGWKVLGDRKLTPETLKSALRDNLGDGFLATRYGRRVRVDDGRLHVILEGGPVLYSVEASVNGDGALLGAAPRLIRTGSRSPEVFVLGSGAPRAAVRRILTLDWSADPGRPGVLVWTAPAPGRPGGVELYSVDDLARQVWARPVAGGRARLDGPPSRLNLELDEADREEPIVRSRWVESYAPPEHPGEEPILLSRASLTPWMGTVALLLHELRRGEPGGGDELVYDRALRERLSASWLARRDVALRTCRSVPPVFSPPESESLVSVILTRDARLSPENLGPESYVLKISRGPADRWTVVDLLTETGASGP